MERDQKLSSLESDEIPFFPGHLLTEVVMAFAVLGLVFILAGVWPKELGPPANTIMTPSRIVPEWYFLWLFGLLKIVPELLGLFLSGLLIMGVLLLPWLDRSNNNTLKGRRKILMLIILTVCFMIVLSVIGVKE
ncbi:cytochrome b subunit of the bc complex [Desulfosporosinus nitroreducens]|nr:cytochrome b subunit of the bc complex [Desulfosporosinus nitroreducens]